MARGSFLAGRISAGYVFLLHQIQRDKIVWNGGYKRTPWGEYYLPLGATTTGTCTTTVTHDVTNTFDVVVEDWLLQQIRSDSKCVCVGKVFQ